MGEILDCVPDPTNEFDPNAVRVIKSGKRSCTPQEKWSLVCLMKKKGRAVNVEVMGKRQNARNRGLEIPCVYMLM